MQNLDFIDTKSEYEYWNICNTGCNHIQIGCDRKCVTEMSSIRFFTNEEQKEYVMKVNQMKE